MGNATCPKCRKEIWSDATVCPYCRSNLSAATETSSGGGVIITILVVLGLVAIWLYGKAIIFVNSNFETLKMVAIGLIILTVLLTIIKKFRLLSWVSTFVFIISIWFLHGRTPPFSSVTQQTSNDSTISTNSKIKERGVKSVNTSVPTLKKAENPNAKTETADSTQINISDVAPTSVNKNAVQDIEAITARITQLKVSKDSLNTSLGDLDNLDIRNIEKRKMRRDLESKIEVISGNIDSLSQFL